MFDTDVGHQGDVGFILDTIMIFAYCFCQGNT